MDWEKLGTQAETWAPLLQGLLAAGSTAMDSGGAEYDEYGRRNANYKGVGQRLLSGGAQLTGGVLGTLQAKKAQEQRQRQIAALGSENLDEMMKLGMLDEVNKIKEMRNKTREVDLKDLEIANKKDFETRKNDIEWNKFTGGQTWDKEKFGKELQVKKDQQGIDRDRVTAKTANAKPEITADQKALDMFLKDNEVTNAGVLAYLYEHPEVLAEQNTPESLSFLSKNKKFIKPRRQEKQQYGGLSGILAIPANLAHNFLGI